MIKCKYLKIKKITNIIGMTEEEYICLHPVLKTQMGYLPYAEGDGPPCSAANLIYKHGWGIEAFKGCTFFEPEEVDHF